VLIDPEPLLPTSGYRVLCHDAMLIDRDAEGMWPMGTQLKLTITMLVVGAASSRGAAVQAGRRRPVLRDDGRCGRPP
jgi:hypothetical protein